MQTAASRFTKMLQADFSLCTLECFAALRLSSFLKTSRLLASWWVREPASPPSGASGSRDSTTGNTKVGCLNGLCAGCSAPLAPPTSSSLPDCPAGVESCPMILVFGCRQSEMDHIYKEETIQARNKGVFKELFSVYSREPGKPKVANKGTTHNPSLPSFLHPFISTARSSNAPQFSRRAEDGGPVRSSRVKPGDSPLQFART